MTSGRRLLLRAAAASLVLTASIAIGLLLFGDFGETEWRILGTTAFISLFSLLSLPGAVLLDQARAQALAWATVALAVIGFALAVTALWADDGETLWKLTGSVAAIALAATQISALTTRLRRGDFRAVRRLYAASTATVVLAAALANAALWGEIDSEGFYRFLGALAVANVLLVVLQPVLRRGRGDAEPYRLRLTFDDGSTGDETVAAADFADAAARAIRAAERGGRGVRSVERALS